MTAAPARPPLPARRWPAYDLALLVALAAEVALFAAVGRNFLTPGNAGEIVRASAEVGLLALALTPVILTGGIDLSGGSLLALCGVVFGATLKDAGWPAPAAALAALACGLAGGGLNAVLVARLRIPALIVTLGTYSLFRGLAEGITGGARNYSDFPAGFLVLGQGGAFGVPTQAFVLAAAAVAFAVLVHRAPFGRALRAIGYSPEGARYAGLPVGRHLASVYVLSGAAAGAAALLYASRLGQAKGDAGTGFELVAITAVVLGGTSIFGGKGSVGGTLLGLAILGVLHNGLRLADLPSELAGVATALLLLAALGAGRVLEGRSRT